MLSKRERDKRNIHSRYWRNKADKEITRIFRGQPCLICGTTENTCGHHLISRAHELTRHDIRNLVPLCPTHHCYSNECAPHSKNALAVVEFVNKIISGYPDQYTFWQDNKNLVGKSDYKAAYERLCEIHVHN